MIRVLIWLAIDRSVCVYKLYIVKGQYLNLIAKCLLVRLLFTSFTVLLVCEPIIEIMFEMELGRYILLLLYRNDAISENYRTYVYIFEL